MKLVALENIKYKGERIASGEGFDGDESLIKAGLAAKREPVSKADSEAQAKAAAEAQAKAAAEAQALADAEAAKAK